MATTLLEQLQRLQAPHTRAIVDPKRTASILFDPKEAATKDRRVIYDLGSCGLQELTVLNPNFQQFRETLFDESTLHLERSVEHKEVNELLNKNIEKFLQHLSPYFLLRPAHLCLEWLLRRFQVNGYNRDELMALVLPYHETNAFVKVIQTLKLKESDLVWSWLKPLQKPGKPLSKSAVINRAATDKGFFHFVCKTTLNAIKEFGPHAHLLQTQLNFYGSIVVGALEAARSVQEWHISTLLPSLIKGLSSDCIDFASATYIITARLVARTQLTTKLCNSLIRRVSAVSFIRLRRTAVLLLIWIFDSQQAASPHFSEETLHYLVTQNWLTIILSSLAKENVDIHSLVVPLMKDSIKAIQEQHANFNDFKSFLETLLNDIEYSLTTAQQVISSFLDCYIPAVASTASSERSCCSLKDGDIIELDSEDDDVDMTLSGNADFQSWYSQYLHKLEIRYPTAFDRTIKESLSSKNNVPSNRNKAVKMALGYRLQSFGSNTCDIYESLYHHTAEIRLMAIKTIIKSRKDYQKRPQNLQLLKECLADRINDNSEEIVNEILKLSTAQIKEILGCQKFVEALIVILYRIQITPQQWSGLSVKVVKHLTSQELVEEYDNNLLLLALMSLLFPVEGEVEGNAIKEIINSSLAEKIQFLKDLHVDVEDFNINKFKKHFLDVIAAAKSTPTAMEIFDSVASQGEHYFTQAMQLYHFILLATACLRQRYSAKQSLQMFKQISSYTKKFPIRDMTNQNWKAASKLKYIPLELFFDFLEMLIKHTSFQDLLKKSWADPAALELHYFLNVFQYVANECFSNLKEEKEQLEWSKVLKELFHTVFQDPKSKAGFLVNFYVYENVAAIENYAILRFRAFKLLQSLMKNNKGLKLSTQNVLKICIALSTKSQIMRLEALETLKIIYNDDRFLNDFLKIFVKSVLERAEEISIDYKQFPLVFYTIIKSTKSTLGNKILVEILDLIKKDKHLEQAVLSQQLLQLLILFNDVEILTQILPPALTALQRYQVDGSIKMLKEPYSKIFSLVTDHLNSQTIETILMDEPTAWRLIENIFNSSLVFMVEEGNLKPIPCVFLESLDEYIVEKMPSKYKQDLFKLIIKTLAEVENDNIFLAANKLLKKCTLDCRPLKGFIDSMQKNNERKQNSPDIRKSLAKHDSVKSLELQVNTLNWKEGVVLMELLENKKKLEHTDCLIPALFELLSCCLSMEEQTCVEYTKQLVLSAILHCCQKASEDGCNLQTALPKTTFRMDQVVKSLRASQNPQTHNNALLLLSHCAALFPQQVLHNIVDIFTFMGFSVVRHDDAFSFHIINDIIVSIVPILVREKSSFIPVLKVFSDIMLDVPEHRRLPLYTKLIETLGSDKYLWMFLCVVFEAHVIDEEKKRLLQNNSQKSSTSAADEIAKRIEIVLELTNTFKPEIILENCIKLMRYLEQLPMQKMDQPASKRKSLTNLENIETSLFDVDTRSDIQLRHYKYVIMQFLSSITCSNEFLRQIALLSQDGILAMKPFYQNFIIRILSYIPLASTAAETANDRTLQKYWKVILHHLHDVLDNAISLLSAEMFLVVVNGLLQHKLLSIRKKVIDLLISKLQKRNTYFMACDPKHFHNLLQPLADIVAGILTKDETLDVAQQNEVVVLQQTALIALKLLSKLFALKHISEFKDILRNLTKISKQRSSISKIVLATVVLCMIEISSNLKAHSLAHLPKFMPHLIKILQDQAEFVHSQPPDKVCVAVVTGIQKLFETLPLFLGPYIVDIITTLSTIDTRIMVQHNGKDQKSITASQKITTIWSKIATEVPVRILVPSCEKAYNKLMASKSYADISVLMKLLHQSLTNANSNDLVSVRKELTALFMEALECRTQLKNSNIDMESVNVTETAIIGAFVAWVLKLSESSFRPLYHKLYNWALHGNQQKEHILTYFLLTNKIAESLKSLFVLFAGDFIEDAARLLNESNASKIDIEPDTEYLTIELLKAILKTLFNIFLYDSKDFINAQRFQYLMPAIVDQLENRLILEQDSLQKLLSECIAQLAVDVSNDVLWKQLNYQVLLKTRASVPEVRIFAFNSCIEIARKLGDDFTPLLPETIPFIAELLEDENPRVEKNTRKSVQELELILGESLQKYL